MITHTLAAWWADNTTTERVAYIVAAVAVAGLVPLTWTTKRGSR